MKIISHKFCLVLFLFFSSTFLFSQDKIQSVEISDSCLYMPIVLTIDGDCFGCHFLTVIFKCPINDFNIVLYNRWGEVVHESNDLKEKWDSTTVIDGVYFWSITGLMIENGVPVSVEKTGILDILN